MGFDDDNEDEEISIDFSKIKNLFKRKKKVNGETKKEEVKSQKPKVSEGLETKSQSATDLAKKAAKK